MERFLMGLIKQLIREIKRILSNIFGFITRRDTKKKRRARIQEPVEIPRSWEKGSSQPRKTEQLARIKYKRRIPGLKQINRVLAGLWLFMNFVFSQVLLGNIGSQAQWMFLFFLGNCYFILKYLWGSRKDEKRKTISTI